MIFKDLEVLVLYSQSNILYIAKQKRKKKMPGVDRKWKQYFSYIYSWSSSTEFF